MSRTDFSGTVGFTEAADYLILRLQLPTTVGRKARRNLEVAYEKLLTAAAKRPEGAVMRFHPPGAHSAIDPLVTALMDSGIHTASLVLPHLTVIIAGNRITIDEPFEAAAS